MLSGGYLFMSDELVNAIRKAGSYQELSAICQKIDREVLAGRVSMYVAGFLCKRASKRYLEIERGEGHGESPPGAASKSKPESPPSH